MLKQENQLSKDNKDLFELLNHIQFNIQNDKDMLEQNIETSSVSRLRAFMQDPQQAVLDTYAESESIITEMICKSIARLILGNKDVKEAKYNKNGSTLNFYLVLKKDSHKSRNVFNEVSYKLLDSPLADNFKVNFNFVTTDFIKEIKAKEVTKN